MSKGTAERPLSSRGGSVLRPRHGHGSCVPGSSEQAGCLGQVTVRKGTHTCGRPQHAVPPWGLPFSVAPACGRGTTALSTAQWPLFWSSDHGTFRGGPHAQTQTGSVVPTSPWGETEAGSGGSRPGKARLLPAEHSRSRSVHRVASRTASSLCPARDAQHTWDLGHPTEPPQ